MNRKHGLARSEVADGLTRLMNHSLSRVMQMNERMLIVGAGFSGAVLARALAEEGEMPTMVIDERSHVAGNCHTERSESGIMTHVYGPHIFHTSDPEIWSYVNRFADFRPFLNRVKASIEAGVFSMPINLHTINQFFKTRMTPSEAKSFLANKADSAIGQPANFEEQALKFIGPELYHAFFRGYTIKQWGCDPKQLPASILKRLPVRFDYNDNYYNSHFQGIPAEGYTELVSRILDHPLIEVKLGLSYEKSMNEDFQHVFYTGSIDRYFDFALGRLSYRTVFWEKWEGIGDHQGNPVINYPDLEVAQTRVHEHKHFAPWEQHKSTVVFTEYSKETSAGETPYYPKRLAVDMILLDQYQKLIECETHVAFLGRLGTYRYMDMHQVIAEALNFARNWIRSKGEKLPLPRYHVS